MKSTTFIILALSAAVIYGLLSAREIPEGDIIFSHKNHAGNREIDCVSCHGSVEKSTSSSDKNLPAMDLCCECHDDKPDSGECGLCHRSSDDPLALINPRREVIFSHKAHLGRNLMCKKCHRGVEEADKITQSHFPDMWVCMECHDGKELTSECSTCHTESERLKAEYHGEGWTHRHKFDATHKPEKCRLCHTTDDSCDECHFGDNLQQRSHKLNYEFEHPMDAKGKEKDCAACHDEASFCTPCHRDSEVMPKDHSLFYWITSGHGEAAERDIESCIVCHGMDDLICLKCHIDRDGELDTISPAYKPGGGGIEK